MKTLAAILTVILLSAFLLAMPPGVAAAPVNQEEPTATPTSTPAPTPTPGYELDNSFTWGDISTVGLLCAGGVIFLVMGTVAILFIFLQWAERRRME